MAGYSYVKLTEKTINGVTFEVSVNSDGEFKATVAGKCLKAESLKELEKQARKLCPRKRPEIAVEATKLMGSRGTQDVVFTGIHGGTGNVLATFDDGDKEQVELRYGSAYVRRLTPEEKQTYATLHKANAQAEAALTEFIESVTVKDLRQKVEQTFQEALDKLSEPEAVTT